MNTTLPGASAIPASPCREKADIRTVPVWDLPTRAFHWLMALSFVGAYLSSESERFRDVHVMFGYTLAALIGFRLVWGLIGTRYARFSSFLFSPGRLVEYLKSLVSGNPQHHVGHNPAGALAIFLLLGLGLATVVSGFASYQEIGGEWLEELHEAVSGAMLAVVAVHILGVVVSSVLHRENLAKAMITGRKVGTQEQGIAKRRGLVGVLLVVAVLGYWGADRMLGSSDAQGDPGTPQVESRHHADRD